MRIKQIIESKNLIIEGFFHLLKEKEYHKIIMSEVAIAAGISRMTLYRHFNDIEDILNYYLSTIHQLALEKFHQLENQTFRQLLLIRNQIIYENDHFKIILANNDVKKLVLDYTRSFMQSYASSLAPIEIDEYKRAFLQGGVNHVTEKWFLSDMQETPEEITEIIVDLFRKVILN
ncbi:MAG: TetR/AcrR family transcriptional regulator [Acholeplasma sp.]|jgi:AcrR family transcriptional regulator|nr:MAG: TetR/AcrR family transcriptional regulator [Acholeplasma sp.]